MADGVDPDLDPLAAPLTYPGRAPDRPAVLLLDDALLGLMPLPSAPVGEWLVDQGSRMRLDEALHVEGAGSMAERQAVLAVGSNASPAQIRRKFAMAQVRPVVPITAVRVQGLAVGVSAHVSKAGYVPATPVFDPAASSHLYVTWLDERQLAAMDRTEPNYLRVQLGLENSVILPSGQPVARCWVYASRHGHLVTRSGRARPLTDQATLISGLMADLPSLRVIAGTSAEDWIVRTSGSAEVRDRIRRALKQAGLTRDAPDSGISP